MTRQFDVTVEGTLPVVLANGLNTLRNIDFDSGSNSCALPAATTIGGQSVVALANITSSATTGAGFSVTGTGIYTGTGLINFTANSATTGVVQLINADGLTTGTVLSLLSNGTIVTTGEVLNVAANSATTSTGIVRVSATGLTDGWGLSVTSGGANLTASGGIADLVMGAATVGSGLRITNTAGVYTGTTGILAVTANSATTGTLVAVSGTGITSGKALVITGTAATLTTGRYISANDAATEVFGIGANGHIHSTASAVVPTIAVTTQAGITAAAITAGGSDTCGVITTTGTSTGATQLTVTFGKTYTTAPKAVILTAANAAAGMPNTGYIVDNITATTFRITVAAGGTYAATPSFMYLVIA